VDPPEAEGEPHLRGHEGGGRGHQDAVQGRLRPLEEPADRAAGARSPS
jgi:hypothetical protein